MNIIQEIKIKHVKILHFNLIFKKKGRDYLFYYYCMRTFPSNQEKKSVTMKKLEMLL